MILVPRNVVTLPTPIIPFDRRAVSFFLFLFLLSIWRGTRTDWMIDGCERKYDTYLTYASVDWIR